MNLRAGIDTHPPDFFLLVKLNLPFDDRSTVINFLKEIEKVNREKTSPERNHGAIYSDTGERIGPKKVANQWGLNLLVGFGIRFFLGPLNNRGNEEVIQNFPPGGIFEPRIPTRFQILDRYVPIYLRTMNVHSDLNLIGKQMTSAGGKAPSDEELKLKSLEWISDRESDIFLIIESNNRFLTLDFWDAIRKAIEPFNFELVSIHDAFNRGDKRDHTGYRDGTGNMQDKIISDPQGYRSKIYLPSPAPAYPGEPDWTRDDPRYDGGTYLVHRKFVEHLDLWNSDNFQVKDHSGKTFHGFEARQHAIGRDKDSGKVICRFDDRQLDEEPDSTEVNLGYNESHILKARGGKTAPFSAPFPPLKANETNVFDTQDIRIRRRGANFCEIDSSNGKITYGLNFLCFQNNIQQTGFEFIQNIWLDNPLFRRSQDGLFNPESNIIEPIDGCYYFIQCEHRNYAGEVFFEQY